MSTFTMIVILGILTILGGISLMATPLLTFISAGYYIIILFFIWGIIGIARGIAEKRYNKDFFFSILSLILGIVGLVVPGAAAMNNSVLLYLAAGWFIIHGVLSIITAIGSRQKGDGAGLMILGIVLGVLELIMGIYSIAHPAMLAVSLGFLIGAYFIESGVSTILVGAAVCKGGNSMTILFTAMGILTIIGGVSMLATPLLNFLSAGYCIIMLFFFNGVLGIVRGFIEKRYGKEFIFAILSLILGIVGFAVPGVAELNNSILLYLAAGWFLLHGVLAIIHAIQSRKEEGTGFMVVGILLGVLELVMGVYSIAHPAVLVISLGFLTAFYFIESGINMIFIGSVYSRAVAAARSMV